MQGLFRPDMEISVFDKSCFLAIGQLAITLVWE